MKSIKNRSFHLGSLDQRLSGRGVGWGDSKSQYFTHLGLTEFDRLQKETWRDGYRRWKTHLVSSAVNHTDRKRGVLFVDKCLTINLTPPTCETSDLWLEIKTQKRATEHRRNDCLNGIGWALPLWLKQQNTAVFYTVVMFFLTHMHVCLFYYFNCK